MPICIECRFPVHQLYTTYSKADDRSLGKGVRLTQCPRCKRFADKYVEHDFVILFIDLVLIKPQVYRHLLFNKLGSEDDRIDRSIWRFGLLLLLFDVYLTWARVEKVFPQPDQPSSSSLFGSGSSSSLETTNGSSLTNDSTALDLVASRNVPIFDLTDQNIVFQYTFFVLLCTFCGIAFHIPIRLLAQLRIPKILPQPYPFPNRISTALLVSSITKLFPILMLVWNYDIPTSASAVAWAVIANNVAALEILLDCGWVASILLVSVGVMCRAAVGWVMLKGVGVDMGRLVGVGDGGLWDAMVGLFGLV